MEIFNINIMETIKIIRVSLTVGLFLYSMYFLIICLFSFSPDPKYPQTTRKNRFAAVIAARNEEEVIANLVQSLKKQNYPKDLYDIIVIPNNCTDNTEQVALKSGAKIFKCKRNIKSKGDVLAEFFDHMMSQEHHGESYDAYCIFDADNLVDKDFIESMNKALESGAYSAQGYRDSKNPYDSAVSGSYAIYYYAANRFFNHARSRIGLSALISGSGFMISHKLVQRMGGWNTQTMTEDIELTAKCVLMDCRVYWVPDAKIYDEQPLAFEQSWIQRKRWTTGLIQVTEIYLWPLIKKTLKEGSLKSFDVIMFMSALIGQILHIMAILLTAVVDYELVSSGIMSPMYIVYRLLGAFALSYIFCIMMSTLAVIMAHKRPYKMRKGILYFWVFVFSWIPINIMCMIKKETVWHQIDHIVSVNIDDIKSEERD